MARFPNWRLSLILIFAILIGAAIVSRLFSLQVLQRKMFQAQALGQQVAFSEVTGDAGQIFSVLSQESKGKWGSGEIKSLAINKKSWNISTNPKEIADKKIFAKKLSPIIGIAEDDLLAKIDEDSFYVLLKEKVPSDTLEKIKELNLKGLYWQNFSERLYPQGEMLSQVLGFIGGAGSGQYGLEGYYDEIIKGRTGIQEKRSGLQSIFSPKNLYLNGSDLYLTIDYNIQFQAEELLKAQKEKNDIDSGQIIVMRPDTGRIVAMANFPNFNPNKYGKEKDLAIFQNSVTQKLFEPGSIMKPLTMAAALNENKITPETKYIDIGSLSYGAKVIRNFNNEIYGEQTMTQVLESSINTGAVYAEQQIGNKKFFEYVERFGLTQKTNIDLQGEVYSRNESLKNGFDMTYATASFGQGIEMTPLQIARAFCAFANGGRLVKPYIVEKIVGEKEVVQTKPEISQPIISQKAASQINSMLISVVDNGFNKVAKIPGYYLAGKTGTAQVPLKAGRGYEADKTIQSFVGYGPALNPQFLILVKLDNPKVAKSSLSAVPVFKELAQYIINYWKIPPDYEVDEK